jgi:hypothetical protein
VIPVLLAVLLTVSAQAVPPAFEAAQASFLRGSANDGFHEALGDTIALSVTPEYLKQVGRKYHIPANTPYARYFLAQVYQFQFYRALCKQSGHTGPLHRCSFYGDKAAGKRLGDMMAMGSSRPWPEALEAATGQREMDATAILEYFAPLKAWLDEQNKGQTVGWTAN